MKRVLQALALVLALALVASACGGRQTDVEAQAGDAQQFGGGGGVAPGDASTPEVGESDGLGSDGLAGTADDAVADPGSTDGGSTGVDTGAGGATGSGGSAGSGTDPGSGGDTGTGAKAPTGPLTASDVGVTPTSITVGLVTTLTGIVPGLFRGAVIGAQAYAAYQNNRGGILGRKLQITVADDKLSGDEYRAQVIRLSPNVFSFLNNFSVYEEVGVPEMRKRGVPDVGFDISAARKAYELHFTASPAPPGWRLGPITRYKEIYGDKILKKVGALVVNVDSPRQTWEWNKAALKSLGYELIYERFYQPTETDFTADVVKMKRIGVEYVTGNGDWQNFVRISKAMAQQQWKPTLVNFGANSYDPRYIEIGGSTVEGSVIDMQTSLYLGEDAGAIPEITLMQEWIDRVSPGFKADIFTLYGWISGRLFTQGAEAVGPELTRAKLAAAMNEIHDFDANGLIPPGDVGGRTATNCYVIVKVQGGKFVRDHPSTGYDCNGGYFRVN
jgi:branched-chain amino acid transport system substrate-binding protein